MFALVYAPAKPSLPGLVLFTAQVHCLLRRFPASLVELQEWSYEGRTPDHPGLSCHRSAGFLLISPSNPPSGWTPTTPLLLEPTLYQRRWLSKEEQKKASWKDMRAVMLKLEDVLACLYPHSLYNLACS